VRKGAVPGVAVAAVLPSGEVVSAAAGLRNTGTGAAMAPDTVVWIASMTKAITSAAAMQLVEQGKLSLDAPAAAAAAFASVSHQRSCTMASSRASFPFDLQAIGKAQLL
jgi:CubicO group peptidase (beta-lactamase class C family)